MAKLPLSLILALFLVKANVAAPSTEARFNDEAKSGETQESPLHKLSLWITKIITKIETVVLEKIENINNWTSVEILKELKSGKFNDELASLKEGLISDFEAVITDVQSKIKGTVYYYTPPHGQRTSRESFFFKNLKVLGLGRQIGLKFWGAFWLFPAKLFALFWHCEFLDHGKV
jgi:hypothetical protein